MDSSDIAKLIEKMVKVISYFVKFVNPWPIFCGKKGANVNAMNKSQETPLHFACWNGNGPAVEMLIRLEAKVDAQKLTSEVDYNELDEK